MRNRRRLRRHAATGEVGTDGAQAGAAAAPADRRCIGPFAPARRLFPIGVRRPAGATGAAGFAREVRIARAAATGELARTECACFIGGGYQGKALNAYGC